MDCNLRNSQCLFNLPTNCLFNLLTKRLFKLPTYRLFNLPRGLNSSSSIFAISSHHRQTETVTYLLPGVKKATKELYVLPSAMIFLTLGYSGNVDRLARARILVCLDLV